MNLGADLHAAQPLPAVHALTQLIATHVLNQAETAFSSQMSEKVLEYHKTAQRCSRM